MRNLLAYGQKLIQDKSGKQQPHRFYGEVGPHILHMPESSPA